MLRQASWSQYEASILLYMRGRSSEQKMDLSDQLPWYRSDSHENLVVHSGPCARQGGMVLRSHECRYGTILAKIHVSPRSVSVLHHHHGRASDLSKPD